MRRQYLKVSRNYKNNETNNFGYKFYPDLRKTEN